MKFLRIVFCLFTLLIVSNNTANASQTVLNITKYYLYLTNPVSAFYFDGSIIPIFTLFDERKNISHSRSELGLSHQSLIGFKKEKTSDKNSSNLNLSADGSLHENFLVKILSFGNRSALLSLNKAKILGENFIPYKVVNFGANMEEILEDDFWYFVASSSNGSAMFVYGYSWLINLPAKFLKNIEKISYFSPKSKGTYPATWWELIDLIVNFFSLLIEIPLAFIGTIFGVILGTIMHPLDTLCAFPAGIYFMIVTTFNAVWDTLVSLVMIPYNLFFVW